MAWLAVDSDGSEFQYGYKPIRLNDIGVWEAVNSEWDSLPSGSIEKLIGKKLTWEDDPVEI